MSSTNRNTTVTVSYYSDILCVWAYIAQIKLDQLRKQFGDRIHIHCHYLSVFGDTQYKISTSWQHRGGHEGYHRHLHEVVAQFDHVTLHHDIWRHDPPASSMGCHLFLKALQLLQQEGVIPHQHGEQFNGRSLVEEAAWRCRLAFFEQGINIAQTDNQLSIAESLGLPVDMIRLRMDNGSAFARLSADLDMAAHHMIQGSPTFLLNEGRQKLYGNVGYRIIEANIQELLEHPDDIASWC